MKNSADTKTAVLTLANLLGRALDSETDKSRKANDCGVEFITPAFGGGLCILVSGEGSKRKAEIDRLAAHLTTLFGAAVTVGTDEFEDYKDGQYTCMWLNIDAAETVIDRMAA